MADDKSSIELTAARLQRARKAKNLTQSEVAEKADISVNHYAQIERGEKNPTVSTFKSILKALNITSSEILDK